MSSTKKKIVKLCLLSKDPNLIWLAEHLGETEGFKVAVIDDYKKWDSLDCTATTPAVLMIDVEEPANLIREIRNHYPRSPLLVLTPRQDQIEILSREGADRVFLKPCRMEHLHEELMSRLNKMEESVRKIKHKEEIPMKDGDFRFTAKIMIVDDEEEVCEFIRDMLGEVDEGDFEVQFAYDPETALKLCGEFEPDLAIVDLKLPQLSGLELIERLKRLPGAKPKDFLIFTGVEIPESRQQIEAQGFTYLTKPCSMDELIHTLTGMCHKWKLVKKAA